MDEKNTTLENISKNFSQTLESVLTLANITNRQTDSWLTNELLNGNIISQRLNKVDFPSWQIGIIEQFPSVIILDAFKAIKL